jgi:DNA-binding response OmpR family regulator
MPHRKETDPTKTITILSVSPFQEDHLHLQEIVSRHEWTLCPDSRCVISTTPGVATARDILREHRLPIAVCERDLLPGTGRGLLDHISTLPDPPLLIVTSRLADEHLWAEALDLGAYDVVAKPFDPAEVIHTLRSAWLHWKGRHDIHTPRSKQHMAAAS